jgi:hypothetical protein
MSELQQVFLVSVMFSWIVNLWSVKYVCVCLCVETAAKDSG